MKRLYTSIFNKKEKALVSVLDGFIQQIYWGDNLNKDESMRNLEEGLIELTKFGNHSSNGILITEDGYFLTAKHCLYGRNLQKIRLHNGKTYDIKKVCKYDDDDEIALAKAGIPSSCKTKEYRIFNTNKMEKIPLVLLTRRNGELIRKYGNVERGWNPAAILDDEELKVYHGNHFQLNIKSKPGDSGGIFISPDGRLMGMLSGGDHLINAFGIKIIKALELVDSYKRDVQKGL